MLLLQIDMNISWSSLPNELHDSAIALITKVDKTLTIEVKMADMCFISLSHCLLLDKNNIFDTSMSSHFNQALFKRRGGDFRDNTCVQQIVPGDVVRVKTNRRIWHADSLVVTVGPWAGGPILKRDLMLSLPLEVRGFYICVTKVRVIAFISSTGRSQSHSYYSVGCSFDNSKWFLNGLYFMWDTMMSLMLLYNATYTWLYLLQQFAGDKNFDSNLEIMLRIRGSIVDFF